MKSKFWNPLMLLFLLPFFVFAQDRAVVGPEEELAFQEVESSFVFDYSSVYIPASVQMLKGISILGNEVELEDGSRWTVDPSDGRIARQWLSINPELPISITQNRSWFSSYYYRIINHDTGASIVANLKEGPWTDIARRIIDLDFHQGIALLADSQEKTHWEISSRDKRVFSKWRLDDFIIIGINSGWDSSCECILINVTANNFARAHQF